MKPKEPTPNFEKAKNPGVCYNCGLPIYKGDKIRICHIAGNDVAVHKDCYHS